MAEWLQVAFWSPPALWMQWHQIYPRVPLDRAGHSPSPACHTLCSLPHIHSRGHIPLFLCATQSNQFLCIWWRGDVCGKQYNYLPNLSLSRGVIYRDENSGSLRAAGRHLAHPEVCTCRNHSLSTWNCMAGSKDWHSPWFCLQGCRDEVDSRLYSTSLQIRPFYLGIYIQLFSSKPCVHGPVVV